VLVTGVGACSFVVYRLARGPVDGANQWLAYLDEGDYQAAYDSVCDSNLQQLRPRQTMLELENDFGAGIDEYYLSSVYNENGLVTVTGTVTVGGREQPISFRMENDDDGWKVCEYGFN
jgi:hypothetical protein